MLWVIQSNLFNEEGYVRLVHAIQRLNINHVFVKPIPFTNQLVSADFDGFTDDVATTPDPTNDASGKIVIFGATTLSRVATHRNWIPGTYLNRNFDFSVWRDGFGSTNVLNGDAIVGTVSDIKIPDGDMMFLRPVLDTKSFTGFVLSYHDTVDWLQQVSNVADDDEFVLLNCNTEIMIAPAKQIQAEYRMFIVNGVVVTGSLYKRGNKLITSPDIPKAIMTFTEKMIRVWQSKIDVKLIPDIVVPAKAFVMDVAITPTGMKVIEINNINSAGFYAADVQRIIMAIEDMER